MKIIITITLYIFIRTIAYAQTRLNCNFNIELAEKDSVKSFKLEQSLINFLDEAKSGHFTDAYVDSKHLKKYAFFFEKISGIGKSSTSIYNDPITVH